MSLVLTIILKVEGAVMRKNLIIKYLCLLGCFWVKIDFLADGFNIKKFTSLVRLTPPPVEVSLHVKSAIESSKLKISYT